MNTFCSQCGEDADARDHTRCDESLRMEPPRFCSQCRRRMVVQVVPTGWHARCVEHGELRSVHHCPPTAEDIVTVQVTTGLWPDT